MTDKEKQVAKYFRMTQSYAETGRKMVPVMTRQNIERYILRLRARGIDLPPVRRSLQNHPDKASENGKIYRPSEAKNDPEHT